MSEISESYHLRSATQQDGIALLETTRTPGYVLPAASGWVSVVVADANLIPHASVVRAAGFPVVHYANAADHGWSFSVFDASGQRLSRYTASWEAFDYEVVDDQLDLERAATILGLEAEQVRLVRPLLRPRGLEEVEDADGRNPGHHVAALLGLPWWDHFSYRYLSAAEATGRPLPHGAIRVGELPNYVVL